MFSFFLDGLPHLRLLEIPNVELLLAIYINVNTLWQVDSCRGKTALTHAAQDHFIFLQKIFVPLQPLLQTYIERFVFVVSVSLSFRHIPTDHSLFIT